MVLVYPGRHDHNQRMTSERADSVRALYESFNDRDLDAVLAAMAPDVDWPNGWEGGRLVGRDAVREYWERQWREIRPNTLVRGLVDRPDGTVEARVRLVVRDPAGTVLERSEVTHVYAFDGPQVRRMTIEP
ncbi:ketosteroid isomerase [Aeromicrobium flavum]|uniref:Ketosteroid isomerase n=2 Tax=Aeromicrobium flavum TaxID=416568 RepID=A0A512HRR9_9ACTN|nr:ketosteroid isomerase [Aeromicrobium flavum]